MQRSTAVLLQQANFSKVKISEIFFSHLCSLCYHHSWVFAHKTMRAYWPHWERVLFNFAALKFIYSEKAAKISQTLKNLVASKFFGDFIFLLFVLEYMTFNSMHMGFIKIVINIDITPV